MKRARLAPGSSERMVGLLAVGPVGAAFERRLVETRSLQHGSGTFDMGGFAGMRGTGERDLAIAEAERVGGSGFHQRQRLYRLDRRAREDRKVDVADAEAKPACGIDDGGRASMPALHNLTANGLHQNRVRHHIRLTQACVPVPFECSHAKAPRE